MSLDMALGKKQWYWRKKHTEGHIRAAIINQQKSNWTKKKTETRTYGVIGARHNEGQYRPLVENIQPAKRER